MAQGARRRPAPRRAEEANATDEWGHMVNDDIISMPDKWEYPWYAAWDLAFHTIALSTVDIDFAKQQLDLMLSQWYIHPNGQIPAYEWNFSDVNPPVHAWATLAVYQIRDGTDAAVAILTSSSGLRQIADQLHVVGQPQGPLRQEHLPGRLPRAGQHRRFRPFAAAADRRISGAG